MDKIFNEQTRPIWIALLCLGLLVGAYYLGTRKPDPRDEQIKTLMGEIQIGMDSLMRSDRRRAKLDSIITESNKKNEYYKSRLASIDRELKNKQRNYNEISNQIDDVEFDSTASILDILQSWSNTVEVGRQQIHLHNSTSSPESN